MNGTRHLNSEDCRIIDREALASEPDEGSGITLPADKVAPLGPSNFCHPIDDPMHDLRELLGAGNAASHHPVGEHCETCNVGTQDRGLLY